MLVSNLCGQVLSGGKVGIEIEVEGCSTRLALHLPNGFWNIVDEGSLRGGFELVSKPLTIEQVGEALPTVEEIIAAGNGSERCSVHVHVNASDLSTIDVIKFCLLYLCLERTLIKYKDMRGNNNYCLPFYSLEKPLEFAENMWQTRASIEGRHNKYCALNLKPLNSFGTIEFRGMGYMYSLNRIKDWAETCLSIRNMSQEIKFEQLKSGGLEYLLELSENYPKISYLLKTPEIKEGYMQMYSELINLTK